MLVLHVNFLKDLFKTFPLFFLVVRELVGLVVSL